jgi:NADP-dependent 3-hydroxy acid dehydrogenase YdfG
MTELSDAIALVTGAGGGIGREIARQLVGAGSTVWLVGRSIDALEETSHACGRRTRVRPTDLTDERDIDGLLRDLDSVDVLVHSAGVIEHGSIESSKVTSLDHQYVTNVRAFYVLTQQLLPMLRQKPGQIAVVNSSVVTGGARPGVGQFAATQHSLLALTNTLRQEVNADGIRVLSVFPGRVATSRQERLYANDEKEYRPELLLQPVDVASMVVAALSLPRTAEVTDIHMRPLLKSY